MKNLRLFLYFCVGVLLAAVVELSYAETMSPVSSPALKRIINPNTGVVQTLGAYCTWLTSSHGGVWVPTPPLSCVRTDQFGNVTTYNASEQLYCESGASVVGGQCLLTCPAGQNWTLTNGMCSRPDCNLPEVRDIADGICKVPVPTCSGAQFLDTASNKCICTYQSSSTKSYSVSYANSKAGNLSPPTCNNGCTQAYTGNAIFCPGGLLTMVIGGSTTCYASTFQDGTICSSSGAGGPIQITLAPVTAPAAPAGTNPAGLVDPLSTTPNNGDPLSCSSSGGNWGVFNGKGSCYSPTKADPVLTQTKTPTVVVDPSGKSSTSTTTTTQTCTGVGSCSSSSTTTVGGGGGAGGTTVTSSGQGASGSANITSDGQGNFKLDLPKDYQRDSTGLILNSKVDKLLDTLGELSTDDSTITGAKATDASHKSLTDADKSILDAIKGQDPSEVTSSVNVWTQIMSTSWYEPIPNSTCSAFTSTIGAWSWTLDICPTAAKISEIGAYVAWILLMFAGFSLITRPTNQF